MRCISFFILLLFSLLSCTDIHVNNVIVDLIKEDQILKYSKEWDTIQEKATALDYWVVDYPKEEYYHQLKYYTPIDDTIIYYITDSILTIQTFLIVDEPNQEFLSFAYEENNTLYIGIPQLIQDSLQTESKEDRYETEAYVMLTIDVPLQGNYKGKKYRLKNRDINILSIQKKTYSNATIKKYLTKHKFEGNTKMELFLRAFKHERILELWMKEADAKQFEYIKNYEFCAYIGELGPKRKDNDCQMAEGFYYINKFRPYSDYVHALGYNYPNKSDSILGDPYYQNKMLAIHGSCGTRGCISIEDSSIAELFQYVMCAKKGGQEKIELHEFPCRMNNDGMNMLMNEFTNEPKKIAFWMNLKKGYDYFEKNRYLPVVTVNNKGEYLFSDPTVEIN